MFFIEEPVATGVIIVVIDRQLIKANTVSTRFSVYPCGNKPQKEDEIYHVERAVQWRRENLVAIKRISLQLSRSNKDTYI